MKHLAHIVIVLITLSTSILGCIDGGVKVQLPTPSPFENEKLGTGLNYTAYLYETQGIDAAVTYFTRNPNLIVENGKISVRIPIPEENETYINTLKSIGIEVLYVTNSRGVGGEIEVHAFLPISSIRELGELEFVKAVYVENKPVPE